MAGPLPRARQTGRQLTDDHEGFLRYRRFRWLKRSTLLCLIAVLAYLLVDADPRPNGGSWLGYTLGTIGAGLILWLAMLGIRKRRMTPGAWSLKAWTSAHVYLGLALVVIATLHTGFQLGWNVHSLAYGLMLLVIASGIYGVVVYATLPAALSSNREEMTQPQMVEALRAVDRQLGEAAQPLDRQWTAQVLAALDESAFADGLWQRLTGKHRGGATEAAIATFNTADASDADNPAIIRVEALLQRRKAQLVRIRRHMQLRAMLEVWLYIHVPATVALIAALIAHVISVFFYW